MKALGMITTIFILEAISVLWGGYVFMIIYSWFMPSIFGLPEIGLKEAIAVMVVIGFLTHQRTNTESDDFIKAAIISFTYLIVHPLVVLTIAWFVKSL